MTSGKIKTLYADREQTEALFPKTKIEAVSDSEGTGLNILLENVVHTGVAEGEAAIAPINADTLGGYGLEALKALFVDSIYPVGSIYMSAESTSPESIFGGTWEQLKDRFLLGVGDTYPANSAGGEAMHILTVAEMPSHNHGNPVSSPTHVAPSQWEGSTLVRTTNSTYLNGLLSTDGGNDPHNNMPPYLTVYMWKRTA